MFWDILVQLLANSKQFDFGLIDSISYEICRLTSTELLMANLKNALFFQYLDLEFMSHDGCFIAFEEQERIADANWT